MAPTTQAAVLDRDPSQPGPVGTPQRSHDRRPRPAPPGTRPRDRCLLLRTTIKHITAATPCVSSTNHTIVYRSPHKQTNTERVKRTQCSFFYGRSEGKKLRCLFRCLLSSCLLGHVLYLISIQYLAYILNYTHLLRARPLVNSERCPLNILNIFSKLCLHLVLVPPSPVCRLGDSHSPWPKLELYTKTRLCVIRRQIA